jgi:hypothetical protein
VSVRCGLTGTSESRPGRARWGLRGSERPAEKSKLPTPSGRSAVRDQPVHRLGGRPWRPGLSAGRCPRSPGPTPTV